MHGSLIRAALSASITLVALGAAAGDPARYVARPLLPEAPLHGVNGMQLDADGALIGGSMLSGSVFRVDLDTGAVQTLVGPPRGVADDLTVGTDGSIYWTSTPMGIVHVRRPGGLVEALYRDLPMVNPIYSAPDGRLWAAQVTRKLGSLYELDPRGERQPRLVVADLPGLNGFEVTRDNLLYGPLMHTGEIVRIDLESGRVEVIADGFERPVAVNLDARNRLYVVDYLTGELTRLDLTSGSRRVVARTRPPVDNLAIGADGLIYVSHPCLDGIQAIDPETGATRTVAKGTLGYVGGASLVLRDGRAVLAVASMFCNEFIDPQTGSIERLPREGETAWSGWLDERDGLVVLSSFPFGQLQWLDAATGRSRLLRDGFQAPYQVQFQPDGSVWLAEQGTGRILALSPPFDGEPVVIAAGLAGPLGFVRDGQSLYVSESLGGRISRVNLVNGEIEALAAGLQQPEGIALGPGGRLLIAEVGARRLVALRPGDEQPEVLVADLPVGLPPFMGPPATFLPTAVVATPDGSVYITSDLGHNILKVEPVP